MANAQLSVAEEQHMHMLQGRANEGLSLSDNDALELALLKRRFHLMASRGEDDADEHASDAMAKMPGRLLTQPQSRQAHKATTPSPGENQIGIELREMSAICIGPNGAHDPTLHGAHRTAKSYQCEKDNADSVHDMAENDSGIDTRCPPQQQHAHEGTRAVCGKVDVCSTHYCGHSDASFSSMSLRSVAGMHSLDGTPNVSTSASHTMTPPVTTITTSDGSHASNVDYSVSDSIHKASKAVYFWSSLLATAVPGYLGKKAGLTSQFMHWNYIVPHLLLGAIPVVTQVGSSGNHLDQLRRQLDERGEQLGLVLACLEDDELNGFGLSLIQFAKEMDWRRHVNRAVMYVRVPMEDTKATVAFETAAAAVQKLHECIETRRQTAYVHCKAGKGRSWMIVMCYLTTYGGLEHDVAARLVQERRGQINPSLSQQCFAREFALRYSQRNSGIATLVRRRSASLSRHSSRAVPYSPTSQPNTPIAEVVELL